MIDKIGIRTEIVIEIVTGDTDHAVGIAESVLVLAPKIAETEKEVVRRRRIGALEEESHLYIGMYHHLVSNILLLCRQDYLYYILDSLEITLDMYSC